MGRLKHLLIQCKRCKTVKSRDHYNIRSSGAIRENICKRCRLSSFRDTLTVLREGRRVIVNEFYVLHKKDACDLCGFKGHYSQLDVDHIDQNHRNNDLSNLRTLCANCHRIVTFEQRRSAA